MIKEFEDLILGLNDAAKARGHLEGRIEEMEKQKGESPDYATRLRDEVAMRCFVSYTEGPPETRAANAYINAEAFMSERKRREEEAK